MPTELANWQHTISTIFKEESAPITTLADPRVNVILRFGLSSTIQRHVTPADLEGVIETDAEELGLIYFRHHTQKPLPPHTSPSWSAETSYLWDVYSSDPALVVVDRSKRLGGDHHTAHLEQDTLYRLTAPIVDPQPATMTLEVADFPADPDELHHLAATIDDLARLIGR